MKEPLSRFSRLCFARCISSHCGVTISQRIDAPYVYWNTTGCAHDHKGKYEIRAVQNRNGNLSAEESFGWNCESCCFMRLKIVLIGSRELLGIRIKSAPLCETKDCSVGRPQGSCAPCCETDGGSQATWARRDPVLFRPCAPQSRRSALFRADRSVRSGRGGFREPLCGRGRSRAPWRDRAEMRASGGWIR